MSPVVKVCPRCNTSFTCALAEGCWCAALPRLKTLAPGEDCLCEKCLKAALAVQERVRKRPDDA